MGRRCTQICTLEDFLAQTEKIDVRVLRCLQHEQKIGSFIYLFIYLIQLFSHTSTRQGLIVSGITSFLPFSIFLETIPTILFVPQYVLYSLVFHVILLK